MKPVLRASLLAGCIAGVLLCSNHAMAQAVAEWFEGTNASATNFFLGKVGIGTNDPSSKLHVEGDMTVSGAMKVPRQGDVEMGVYTNGETILGVDGCDATSFSFTNTIGTTAYTNTGFVLMAGSNANLRNSLGTNYIDLVSSQASTNLGNRPMFKVNKGAVNQAIAQAVWTKLTWSNEVVDTDEAFDTADSRFTVPSDGKYYFTSGFVCTPLGGTYCRLAFYTNGVRATEKWRNVRNDAAQGFYLDYSFSDLLELKSNDYVECYLWVGTAMSVWGTNEVTWFSGFKLLE